MSVNGTNWRVVMNISFRRLIELGYVSKKLDRKPDSGMIKKGFKDKLEDT
jgi:hypothetical protein